MSQDNSTAAAIFTPLYDRVLLRRIELNDTPTSSLIIRPDVAARDEQYAEVLAVGSGYQLRLNGQRIPLDVKVGDVVRLGPYTGVDVEIHGEPLLICKEEEILGIRTED